jgi:transposase
MKSPWRKKLDAWAKRREAIYKLHYEKGFSIKEVAEKYNISPRAVILLFNKYKKQNGIQ